MGRNIVFEYMHKDEVCAKVEVDVEAGLVICEEYTTVFHRQALGDNPKTIDSVNDFFEGRCFSKDRPDKYLLLEMIGLPQYNPYDIVRKTRGGMTSDDMWIRFSDDERCRTYEDKISITAEEIRNEKIYWA
jgi:hypothetical protein